MFHSFLKNWHLFMLVILTIEIAFNIFEMTYIIYFYDLIISEHLILPLNGCYYYLGKVLIFSVDLIYSHSENL